MSICVNCCRSIDNDYGRRFKLHGGAGITGNSGDLAGCIERQYQLTPAQFTWVVPGGFRGGWGMGGGVFSVVGMR